MINPEKILMMARTGYNIKQISNRLACSPRQVSRILKNHNTRPGSNPAILKDRDVEHVLMSAYSKLEKTSVAATRFGQTRQAIFQKLFKEEVQ
jgi:AraC-like DNA-binding protein